MREFDRHREGRACQDVLCTPSCGVIGPTGSASCPGSCSRSVWCFIIQLSLFIGKIMNGTSICLYHSLHRQILGSKILGFACNSVSYVACVQHSLQTCSIAPVSVCYVPNHLVWVLPVSPVASSLHHDFDSYDPKSNVVIHLLLRAAYSSLART